MACLKRSMGDVFEQTFMRTFTEWAENDKSAIHLPDFSLPQSHFGVEMKVSFMTYGAQIKEYQINAFPQLDFPVVYFIGFHTYANSSRRWATNKNPLRDLKRNFDLDSVYIVSDMAMQRLFDKEKRLSVKAQEYHDNGEEIPPDLPQWYFGLKSRYINQLLDNEVSVRNGVDVNLREYYGITDDEFSFFTVPDVSMRVSQKRSTKLPIKGIVEHDLADVVVRYLANNQRE